MRLRLYPPSFDTQRVLNWQVSVNGQTVPALLSTATGDRESIWTRSAPGVAVEVVATGEVDTADLSGVVRGLRDSTRPGVYLRSTKLTEADKRIEALAATVANKMSLDRLHALMSAVREAVAYNSGSTSAATTAAQALKLGKGVCQDHAHVFISAARTLNVPARYVVGYLFAPEAKLAETHAWAEAYTPDLGWVGFDPANGICPTDHYVRLACGLDSADAAPIRGSVAGGAQERLSASVDIGETQSQNQTQQ